MAVPNQAMSVQFFPIVFGVRSDRKEGIIVASIQSVFRDPEKLGHRDFLFVDEAHMVPLVRAAADLEATSRNSSQRIGHSASQQPRLGKCVPKPCVGDQEHHTTSPR
jgi:hypothetical protein